MLVGVDVGTTRVKAAVVNFSGAELASAAAETPWTVDGRGVEMNAVDLIGTVRTVIAEAVDSTPTAGSSASVSPVSASQAC